MKWRVEEDASDGNVRLQERAHMRHDSPRERVFALILFGVRRSGGTKQRDTEDIPAARESVLRLRQNGNAVSILAQVGILGKDQYHKFRPRPQHWEQHTL